MSSGNINIRFQGNPSVDQFAETLGAFEQAVQEMAKSLGMAPGDVKILVTEMHYECDGCGVHRPTDRTGWVQQAGGKDYCPQCKHRGGPLV